MIVPDDFKFNAELGHLNIETIYKNKSMKVIELE